MGMVEGGEATAGYDHTSLHLHGLSITLGTPQIQVSLGINFLEVLFFFSQVFFESRRVEPANADVIDAEG